MPVDRNVDEEEFAKDDKDTDLSVQGHLRRFKEFDCPECAANNPYDGTFGNGDEVTCLYCGLELKASVNDDGRLKLKVN